MGAPSFASGFDADSGQALTFTLSGLSKIAGLPQMKVAWIAVSGPDDLKREALNRLEIIADTYLSMNAPVQWAVPAMLEQRPAIQRQLIARIQANLAELDRQLASQKLCARLEVEGGWYVILRVPVTGSDEELAIALLRRTGRAGPAGTLLRFRPERLSRAEPDHAAGGFRPRHPAAASASLPRPRVARKCHLEFVKSHVFAEAPRPASSGGVYNDMVVPKYSIVVPFHNEEENVTELYDRLRVVMEAAGRALRAGLRRRWQPGQYVFYVAADRLGGPPRGGS